MVPVSVSRKAANFGGLRAFFKLEGGFEIAVLRHDPLPNRSRVVDVQRHGYVGPHWMTARKASIRMRFDWGGCLREVIFPLHVGRNLPPPPASSDPSAPQTPLCSAASRSHSRCLMPFSSLRALEQGVVRKSPKNFLDD